MLVATRSDAADGGTPASAEVTSLAGRRRWPRPALPGAAGRAGHVWADGWTGAVQGRRYYRPDLRSSDAGPYGGRGIARLRVQLVRPTPTPIAALSAPANRYTCPAAVLVITTLPLALDIPRTKDASSHPTAGPSAPPVERSLPAAQHARKADREGEADRRHRHGSDAPAVLEGTCHALAANRRRTADRKRPQPRALPHVPPPAGAQLSQARSPREKASREQGAAAQPGSATRRPREMWVRPRAKAPRARGIRARS